MDGTGPSVCGGPFFLSGRRGRFGFLVVFLCHSSEVPWTAVTPMDLY